MRLYKRHIAVLVHCDDCATVVLKTLANLYTIILITLAVL